jgi:hypothetical protein
MSYGPDTTDRHSASYVDRILKGEKPLFGQPAYSLKARAQVERGVHSKFATASKHRRGLTV